MDRIDLAGKKIGRLTVVSFSHVKRTGSGATQHFWNCTCECGAEKKVDGCCLRRESTLSCGCLARERSTTHGLADRHPVYNVWLAMRRRCGNPRDKDYGGRGITVCDRWNDFAVFLADMGDRPTPDHTIERIENDKGYSPDNCKWATRAEQNENTRQTKLITFNGVTLSRGKWAKRLGIHGRTLRSRLDKLGWSVERALTTPAKAK